MTILNIELENNTNDVYLAGDMVKGTIVLQLEEPKKVTGLYFIVHGQAKCDWTESEISSYGGRNNYETVYYEGLNVYLNMKTYLFGHRGGRSVTVEAGIHRYNFECQLPAQLPGSFEAKHGHVRYHVEACLDIPWRFDKETKMQFTVVRLDDLNRFSNLKSPCQNEIIITFCCLFCESEPLLITVTIPCSGFAPGQIIPITVDYVNKSDVKVERTIISLVRTITYNSDSPRSKSKHEINDLVFASEHGVEAGTSKKSVTKFKLPQVLLYSNTRFCKIVQISYDLKFQTVMSGCNSTSKMGFPIVIGAIPVSFDETNNNVAMQMPYTDNPNGLVHNGTGAVPVSFNPTIKNSSMPMPYPDYSNAPGPSAPMSSGDFSNPMKTAEDLPPSFEEAVKMNHEKDDLGKFNKSQPGFGWNVTAATAPEKE